MMEEDTEYPTPPLLSPSQPPPPPPPTPVTIANFTNAGIGRGEYLPRQTSIGFGAAEPPRHRYGDLSSSSVPRSGSGSGAGGDGDTEMDMDEDGPDDDGDAEAAAAVNKPPCARPRVVPRRLIIKTGSFHRMPAWYPRTPAPYGAPQTPTNPYGPLSPTTARNYFDLLTTERYHRTWELLYRFDQSGSGISGGFALVVFLGGPSPPAPAVAGSSVDSDQRERELNEWVKSVEGLRVGGHGVSGVCAGSCGDDDAAATGTAPVISGSIPLTRALIEKIAEVGGSLNLDPERVAPYLRDRLHWVIERADGAIVHLPTLKVRVASYLTDTMAQDPIVKPECTMFPTVYIGKVGGMACF